MGAGAVCPTGVGGGEGVFAIGGSLQNEKRNKINCTNLVGMGSDSMDGFFGSLRDSCQEMSTVSHRLSDLECAIQNRFFKRREKN